jgi:hypothetical protein
MTDAADLRAYAATLRNTKPKGYDDWRDLCLGAADLLVRQASHNEAILKERTDLLETLKDKETLISKLSGENTNLNNERDQITLTLTETQRSLEAFKNQNRR